MWSYLTCFCMIRWTLQHWSDSVACPMRQIMLGSMHGRIKQRCMISPADKALFTSVKRQKHSWTCSVRSVLKRTPHTHSIVSTWVTALMVQTYVHTLTKTSFRNVDEFMGNGCKAWNIFTWYIVNSYQLSSQWMIYSDVHEYDSIYKYIWTQESFKNIYWNKIYKPASS